MIIYYSKIKQISIVFYANFVVNYISIYFNLYLFQKYLLSFQLNETLFI